MGEFNSDDHYICYSGQESLKRNGRTIIVNKRVRNAVLGRNLKNDRMISIHLQGKPFNIMVIQVYAPTSNTKEAEVEWFYEDLKKNVGEDVENLESILKSRDITLPTKVCLVKAMVFPVVTYGYESWTVKKAEC